jgi:hypothetical protein
MWGALPFENTTSVNLAERLDALLSSRAARVEAAERGRSHVERWHDMETVTNVMAAHFERCATIPSRGSSAIAGWTPPRVEPIKSIPVIPRPLVPHLSPPRGTFPIQRVRRGVAGYRGPVRGHLASFPGLEVVSTHVIGRNVAVEPAQQAVAGHQHARVGA